MSKGNREVWRARARREMNNAGIITTKEGRKVKNKEGKKTG